MKVSDLKLKRRILLGTFVLSEGYYGAYFSKAQRVRKLVVDRTKSIFNEFDAIILPTVPSPAYKIGEKKTLLKFFLQIFTPSTLILQEFLLYLSRYLRMNKDYLLESR